MRRGILQELVAEHQGFYISPEKSDNIYWLMAQTLTDTSQEVNLLRPEIKILTGLLRRNVSLSWATENKNRGWLHADKRLIFAHNAIRGKYYLYLGGNFEEKFSGDSIICLPVTRDKKRDVDHLKGQVLEIIDGQNGPLASKYDCTLWCLENGVKIRASN